MKVIFYRTLPRFPKKHRYFQVPRLHPFVLVSAKCGWRFVWGVGEVRGESPGNGRLTHGTAYEENINTNFIRISSPYRAVNTLRLSYTNQSVMLYREIIAVFSQIHTKHINKLCGHNVELYIKIQSLPHSKHTPSRLYKPVS